MSSCRNLLAKIMFTHIRQKGTRLTIMVHAVSQQLSFKQQIVTDHTEAEHLLQLINVVRTKEKYV